MNSPEMDFSLLNKPSNPLVDIFIPTVSNHAPFVKAAIYSALYQTYEPTRIVLWIEDEHPLFEEALAIHWYTPEEKKDRSTTISKALGASISIEQCTRGILVRNYEGRTGTASKARQWYFDWKGKADWVKMLDSDDILFPWAITAMMRYATPDTDIVLCPMLPVTSHRISTTILPDPIKNGSCGSGSLLLNKKFMEKVTEMGFSWPNSPDGDRVLGDFIKNNANVFKVKSITTENAFYLYQKNYTNFVQ